MDRVSGDPRVRLVTLDSAAILPSRPIPGFAPYEVTESGDVYRRMPNGRLRGPLKTSLSGSSGQYKIVKLWKAPRNTFYIHKLVALAYIGPRPDGMQICHNDGDRFNNHYTNLRYDTPKANCEDQKRHGVCPRGELASNVKLTEADVRIARMVYDPANGVSYGRIADYMDVLPGTIRSVIHRKTWSHVI